MRVGSCISSSRVGRERDKRFSSTQLGAQRHITDLQNNYLARPPTCRTCTLESVSSAGGMSRSFTLATTYCTGQLCQLLTRARSTHTTHSLLLLGCWSCTVLSISSTDHKLKRFCCNDLRNCGRFYSQL